MKIAIIGGGFAALASAHFLSSVGEVSVFDDERGAASGIAAGLLHKFIGMKSKKNPFADEALKASLELIRPKTRTGLLRKAQSPEQAGWFQIAAQKYPEEITLIDDETIWIEEAWVVDCPLYLQSLKKIKRTIHNLAELDAFDRIVITAGVHSTEFCDLPLSSTRGQLLVLSGSPLPPTPVSSQIYAIPYQGNLIVGSTYERGEKLDAVATLLPELKKLLPDFQVEQILDVKEGYRASLPGRMPEIKQVNDKTWVFSGLGSKGLLYHAYYAQKLPSLMFNTNYKSQ
jgi:glycine/D-amino acid oxidase-like deaminating enzyme